MKQQVNFGFTMLEIIGSLVIFGILLTTIMGLLKGLRQAEVRYSQETRAIIALENTLESLSSSPVLTKELIEQEFKTEVALAMLPNPDKIETKVLKNNQYLELQVLRTQPRSTLSSVRIPYAP